MKSIRILILFLLISQISKGQDSLLYSIYQNHHQQSRIYFNSSIYAKSIQELEQELNLCKRQDWEKEQLETSVFLAEVYRKVGDLELGIDVLKELEFSVNYPELHMTKLGRIAALYCSEY